MNSSILHYRTFEQLLAEATVDLPGFHQEGFIEPAQLIKVAQRVNYDLGLRIHQHKETVLEIQRGKTRLPADLHLLSLAMVCTEMHWKESVLTGTQTEEILLSPGQIPDNCGNVPQPCITRCGDHLYLKQKFKTAVRYWKLMFPLALESNPCIPSDCPNTSIQATVKSKIRHGFLYTPFEQGNIVLFYLGNLENDEGHLLVPDHPLLNEYYEYAIKQRLLENMLLNGETVQDKLALIEKRFREARNNALSIVNMPDFHELKATWEMNRCAMMKKYYNMFI